MQVTREPGRFLLTMWKSRRRSCGPRDTTASPPTQPPESADETAAFQGRRFLSATGEFDHQAIAQAYSIDSRTIQPGELFFAVKGERMDGHDFVQQALEKGAAAAVIRKDEMARYPVKTGLMAVDDTLIALQTLGAAVRRLWGKPLVGRYRIHRQDHHQRCDCACAVFTFPSSEVRRQLQQSFWIAPDAAEDRARA